MVEESHIERLKELGTQVNNAYAQLNMFFEISIDLLAIATPDGYYVRLSKSWEDVTGWTRDELTSRPFFDFVYDDVLQHRTWEELKKVSKVGALGTVDFTNRYRRKGGGWVELQWRSQETDGLIYAVARVTGFNE